MFTRTPAPPREHLTCLAATSLILLLLTPTAAANPVMEFEGEMCLCRSPVNATVAPQFQCTYSGIVYDHYGQPWVGYPAELITLRINSPCANPVDLHPDGPSDQNGVLTWGAVTLDQGGGACHGMEVMQIIMDPGSIVWGLSDIRSPDVNGDGYVALNDLSEWQQAFVAQSPEHVGDLDCDLFTIALADLVMWQQHFVAN
jgi:hypothetical protein